MIEGTAWNNYVNTAKLNAWPLDSDGNPNSFSAAEQAVVSGVWRRMAEDFAPFDVDVTTEEPTSFNSRICRCLITRDTAPRESRWRVGGRPDSIGTTLHALGLAAVAARVGGRELVKPRWRYGRGEGGVNQGHNDDEGEGRSIAGHDGGGGGVAWAMTGGGLGGRP